MCNFIYFVSSPENAGGGVSLSKFQKWYIVMQYALNEELSPLI